MRSAILRWGVIGVAVPVLLAAADVRAEPVQLAEIQLDTVVAARGGVWAGADAIATARGDRTLTKTLTHASAKSTGSAHGTASGGASGAAALHTSGSASVEGKIGYGVSGGVMNGRSYRISGRGIVAYMVAGMTANITVK